MPQQDILSSKTASSPCLARSPQCLDSCFWPCSADAPAHLSLPSVAGVCVCTQPFMLLLLPQDLVPLKQGLWFDRLPVLGLQSNRPVGVAVLLSTCSWLLCVVLLSVCLPVSILSCVVLCWHRPSLWGAREGPLVEWQRHRDCVLCEIRVTQILLLARTTGLSYFIF